MIDFDEQLAIIKGRSKASIIKGRNSYKPVGVKNSRIVCCKVCGSCGSKKYFKKKNGAYYCELHK